MSHKKIRNLAILALAAASLPVAAQQTPWYGALSAGQSKTDHEFVTNRENAITGAANVSTAFDDKDGAWKATLGYRFNHMFSVELNYADYGSVRSNTTFTVPAGNGAGGVVIDREVKGYGVDGLIAVPLWTDNFSIWGRVGAFRAETRANAQLSGDAIFSDGTEGNQRSNKSTDTVVKFGVGVDWHFSRNVGVRLEYERLDSVGKKFESGVSGTTGEAAIDTLMLGAIVRF